MSHVLGTSPSGSKYSTNEFLAQTILPIPYTETQSPAYIGTWTLGVRSGGFKVRSGWSWQVGSNRESELRRAARMTAKALKLSMQLQMVCSTVYIDMDA